MKTPEGSTSPQIHKKSFFYVRYMNIFILIGDILFFAIVSKIQGVYLSALRMKWTSNKTF